jgi:hypothetical protein
MHSAVIVDGGGGRVLIDCGEDWLGRAGHLCPLQCWFHMRTMTMLPD